MGSCTSVPSSPAAGNNMMHTSDTFRVRQLDARYRKKSVMNLRISDNDLIIEAKGKRGQPELVASLTPDNTRYSLSRYGLPDIPGCPSILINLKGYDASHTDATYVFFCRNNTTLFDRLQAKIKQVQQNKSFRPVSIRTTPIPTPNQVAPITPGGGGATSNQVTFFQEPQFGTLTNRTSSSSNANDHNYYNDPAIRSDEQTRLLSQTQKTTSQQSFKSSGVFQQTPLSPVPECATNAPTQGSAPIKLALAPKNRDEMISRRLESQATTPNGLPRTVLGQFDFPAKPPPRHGHNFYQNSANDYSRTSLSTRSSGQNINQLSARSDCEPLLMSNLSTPQNMRCGKPNSAEHIYVNTANTNEIAGPRTPSSFVTNGPFTAPAGPHNRQRFFPPMEPIGNRDGVGSMNYVTVEHNSLSSSNSTPRTPKTPGTSVQYTPVDFEKTDELHKSQQRSIVRTETSCKSQPNRSKDKYQVR